MSNIKLINLSSITELWYTLETKKTHIEKLDKKTQLSQQAYKVLGTYQSFILLFDLKQKNTSQNQ